MYILPLENTNQNLKDSLANITNIKESYVEETTKELDSIKALIKKENTSDISIYTFILEGNFSAEGNEGKAFYKGSKINKIEIVFYGETGKAIYNYVFHDRTIAVSQQRYNYETNFADVKSADDIFKDEEINFTTDFSGKVIKHHHKKADLDTFLELKKVVPFELN